MASPAALLNQMALNATPSSRRKRTRVSDADQESPSKRHHNEERGTAVAQPSTASGNAVQTRTRRSLTRLPSRSAPASSPARATRASDAYEIAETPEKSRNVGAPREKPKARKQTIRRIKQDKGPKASPFKGIQLDEMRSGAILNSGDSPAKNTRGRSHNPLANIPILSSQQRKKREEGPVKAKVMTKMPEIQAAGRGDDGKDDADVEGVDSHTGKESPEPATQGTRGSHGHTAFSHTAAEEGEPEASGSRNNRLSKVGSGTAAAAEDQDDEYDDGPEQGAPIPSSSSKKKGRPKKTKEERLAQREEEARRREENAVETAAAEEAKFERRGQAFVRNIEDIAQDVGGVDVWSRLGGGAKSITSMAADKTEMDTTRAEAVWRTINKLDRLFRDSEASDEAAIAGLIAELLDRTRSSFLCPGDGKRGDHTIIDVFEQLIPRSAYLLRQNLRTRFQPKYKQPWHELAQMAQAARNLCDVAADWMPRPSTLETGIRKHVRNDIRPALNRILCTVGEKIRLLEYQDRCRRDREELAKAQKLAMARRQRWIEELEGKVVSGGSMAWGSELAERPNTRQVVVTINDISDISDDEVPTRGQGQRQRQGTEEIPAPDPEPAWTRDEDVALLNGLQRYQGADRITRILEQCATLSSKDMDQCLARARFHKQSCQQELIKKAAEGDNSWSWLESV